MLVQAALLSALVFASPTRQLRQGWKFYTDAFIVEGRVLDKGITTSEGQAYAMLRAAWISDKRTFESLRSWTLSALQHGDKTKLPAWRWDGRITDPNPASDADLLMIYALIIAAERWDVPEYRSQALGMANNLWDQEVARIPFESSNLVLLPGSWALKEVQNDSGNYIEDSLLRINLSYFFPPAIRSLAQLDSGHPWLKLLDHSYYLMEQATKDRLPPDWLYLDPKSGKIATPKVPDHDLFGFEAMRIPWCLAADAYWYKEPRAISIIDTFKRLGADPKAISSPNGISVVEYQYSGMLAAMLPALELIDQDLAKRALGSLGEIWSKGSWGDPTDYYAQNWAWFGLALWSGLAVPPERIR